MPSKRLRSGSRRVALGLSQRSLGWPPLGWRATRCWLSSDAKDGFVSSRAWPFSSASGLRRRRRFLRSWRSLLETFGASRKRAGSVAAFCLDQRGRRVDRLGRHGLRLGSLGPLPPFGRLKPDRPVVCFGDSMTSLGALGGYPRNLQGLISLPVANLGIGGISAKQTVENYLSELTRLNPQVVVIELWAHDFLRGYSRAATQGATETYHRQGAADRRRGRSGGNAAGVHQRSLLGRGTRNRPAGRRGAGARHGDAAGFPAEPRLSAGHLAGRAVSDRRDGHPFPTTAATRFSPNTSHRGANDGEGLRSEIRRSGERDEYVPRARARNMTTASGGRVRLMEEGRPCDATGTARRRRDCPSRCRRRCAASLLRISSQ